MEKLLISLLRAAFMYCKVNKHILVEKLKEITNYEYDIQLVKVSDSQITCRMTNNMCIVFSLVKGVVRDIKTESEL